MKNTKYKLNPNDTQFIISYSKAIAKEERVKQLKLENMLQILENKLFSLPTP